MRFKVIFPKYLCYLSSVIYLIGASVLAHVGGEALANGYLTLALFLYVFGGIALTVGGYNLNRFIYESIDLKSDTFVYGNLFFTQEIPVTYVRSIGHYPLQPQCLKIEIEGRKYFIINLHRDHNPSLNKP